jgi:hypothetical protein
MLSINSAKCAVFDKTAEEEGSSIVEDVKVDEAGGEDRREDNDKERNADQDQKHGEEDNSTRDLEIISAALYVRQIPV